MTERIIVLLIVYASILRVDWSFLKSTGKGKGKEKVLYITFMLVSLYLGIDYMGNLGFYGFYDLIEFVFLDIATVIDKWLLAP